MDVVWYEPHHADSLVALFRACECPCYCRFWHFPGDKNGWLERCALQPELNEAELRGDGALGGVVALEGVDAVGWMKLAPRASLPKLRGRPVYRAHDLGPDEGVLAIGCMLVHPAHRRRGVARALVAGSLDLAQKGSARAIEAYPHAMTGLGDHEVWMGPHELFASLGFVRVAGESPYPVMRFTI